MQVKQALKGLLLLVADLARRITFGERRQQRQQPSLAEFYRENSQSWSQSWFYFGYMLCEQMHQCLLNNPILGFLLLPVHLLICCCSCLYWRRQNQGETAQETIERQAAELALLRAQVPEQEQMA